MTVRMTRGVSVLLEDDRVHSLLLLLPPCLLVGVGYREVLERCWKVAVRGGGDYDCTGDPGCNGNNRDRNETCLPVPLELW